MANDFIKIIEIIRKATLPTTRRRRVYKYYINPKW